MQLNIWTCECECEQLVEVWMKLKLKLKLVAHLLVYRGVEGLDWDCLGC